MSLHGPWQKSFVACSLASAVIRVVLSVTKDDAGVRKRTRHGERSFVARAAAFIVGFRHRVTPKLDAVQSISTLNRGALPRISIQITLSDFVEEPTF